jgi:hypothetical protein
MKGTGNLGLFSLPTIKFPSELEAFPPTDKFEKDTFRDDLTGTQTWDTILIPRSAGKLTIPRIQMSFFNPNTKRWERTQTNPIEISILPGEQKLSQGNGLTKREVELIGQDIRFIHTKPVDFTSSTDSKPNTTVFIYLCSILLFVSPTFISKYTGHRLSTAESRTIRGALKSGLKELKKKGNDPFETASKAYYIYLKNKLGLPTHNLDPASVETHIGDRIHPESLNSILTLLKACDAGKYAPGGLEREASILSEMANAIKQTDRDLS